MNEKSIRDRLVEQGEILFRAPKQPISFTKEPQADALLNDLDEYPHAFVIACVMDRQIKSEKAWLIPFRIMQRINEFSIEKLSSLTREDVKRIMREPESLHRFVDKMANYFFASVQRIMNTYSGDASLILEGKPSSAEVVYRFLQFEGVGPKIGSMAANTLAREFKIPFSDYNSIDISADVHVRRVFSRLGLCNIDVTVEQLIYKARALYPQFPGMMDFPAWEIGRNWCKAHEPLCDNCYMNDLCETADKK